MVDNNHRRNLPHKTPGRQLPWKPAGTRLERTQQYFADVEAQIRKLVGNDQIDVMLDNIGLPYSGINVALSDSATVGPMDGEILISLTEKHSSTPALIAMLRRELPKRFAELQFFFQPADIVDQVLNFGQPAPIDIRVSGPNNVEAYALAAKLAHDELRVRLRVFDVQHRQRFQRVGARRDR